MSQKRKLILLRRDKSVKFTKKKLAQVIAKGMLSGVEWVLIPIYRTGCSYIAVAADTLLIQQFKMAHIKFHLMYKEIGRAGHNYNEPEENTLYDYYVTEMSAYTQEELYQVLYQVGVFRYIQEFYSKSDYVDTFWYMSMDDISVELYDGKGKVFDHFEFRQSTDGCDDVPFNYSRFGELCRMMAHHFGLIGPDDELVLHNISINYNERRGGYTWKVHKEPVQLFSNVAYVGVANAHTKSFTLLTDDEYDQSLRMQNGQLFVVPICLYDYEKEVLPSGMALCHQYNIPKYRFGEWNGGYDPTEDFLDTLYHYYGSAAGEIYGMDFYDAEEMMLLIDNLYFVMQVYTEGAKISGIRDCNLDDIQSLSACSNCVVELIVHLDSPKGNPSDNDLIIVTDYYEDYPPDMKRVSYLLQLEGK